MTKKSHFLPLSTRVVYQTISAVTFGAQGLRRFGKSFGNSRSLQARFWVKVVYHRKKAVKTDRMRDTAIST